MSILISSVHGQFDNISILFLLAAILVSRRGGSRSPLTIASLSLSLLLEARDVVSSAALRVGVGGGVFHSPLAALPYAVFLGSFLPYGVSWTGIANNVFRYRSLTSRLRAV